MTRLLVAIALVLPGFATAQEPTDAATNDAEMDAGDADAGGDDAGDVADAGAEPELLPPVVEIPDDPIDIVVGLAGSEPFVVETDTGYQGISVEIWEELAKQRINYEYRRYPNVLTLVNAVARREVDIGVGPISITSERAARVGFTQPHFSAAISIAARPSDAGVFGRLSRVFNAAFFTGMFVFLLVLMMVGTLLWLAERKANTEQFPRGPLAGIANGVWLALVTLTTVGYGDRYPITPRGRVITGIWMLFALVGTSSLTAFLATTLTLSGLEEASVDSIEDLDGSRVAVPRGTSSVRFVRRHGGRAVLVDGVEEALAMAADGAVEAAVFDRAVLSYHIAHDPDLDLVLSPSSYDPVGYGYCVPLGSELEDLIDIELLEIRESPRLETIRTNWLGE